VSGCTDGDDQNINENDRYLGGHSILFNGYDRIAEDRIEEIGDLLFDQSVSRQAKEVVLMLGIRGRFPMPSQNCPLVFI
jgi:hypothetical protein